MTEQDWADIVARSILACIVMTVGLIVVTILKEVL